jgi:rRNA large subunit m3Psi methyltransferase RlmH
MKITLVTVGKTDVKWVKEGLDLYKSRLVHYAQFSVSEIPELKNVSALSKEQIKTKEGELLLSMIKPADFVVLNSTRIPGTTFNADDNQIAVVTREGVRSYPKKSKQEVASDIIDVLQGLLADTTTLR